MNEKGIRCLSPNQCIDNLLTGACKSSNAARAIEGPLCNYFIVHAKTPADVAYSADFGYWPVANEALKKHMQGPAGGATESVRAVCIVFCESILKYVGYFYVVGGLIGASAADTSGIQLPAHWQSLRRIAWVRAGPLALAALRSQPQYLPQNIELDLLLNSADGQALENPMGANLCSLIDRLSTIRSMSLRDRSVTQTGRALYSLSTSNAERQNRHAGQMK